MLIEEITLEEHWLALSLIPNIGHKTILRLLEHFEKIENIFQHSTESLSQVKGISKDLAQRILHAKNAQNFQMERKAIASSDVELFCFASKQYPNRLAQIASPPPILYVQGNFQNYDAPMLGVVGSRGCSAYGKKHTRRMIKELSELVPNLVIVSGLARGVDTVAHESALEFGLPTLAILAGGLKHIYPVENQRLAEEIQKNGALLSEFPLLSKPISKNFPIRNRIISGLSNGVLLTEANLKSGALITARFALEQNREVFALPGSVDSPLSRGTNRLISRAQAKLVMNANEILEDFANLVLQSPATQLALPITESLYSISLQETSEKESLILKGLLQGLETIDELQSFSKIEIDQLLVILIELEMKEIIHSTVGQQYKIKDNLQIVD